MNRVLIGGGHAHLHALGRIPEWLREGGSVTVVAPGPFWYSGMGPGLLSGAYRADDDIVDIARLVSSLGGQFIQGRARQIDAAARTVTLEDGEVITYDVLSLNVGSEVPLHRLPGAEGVAFPVKPVSHFCRLRDDILAHPAHEPVRLVVVGAGPAGCEAIANAEALIAAMGRPRELTLVTSESAPLSGLPARAGNIMSGWLKAHNIHCRFGVRAEEVHASSLRLADGCRLPFDFLVVATGVQPSSLPARSGLPTAPNGAMRVDEYLQCIHHPEIFGGGDCIYYQPYPLDPVGVYAVRQGPILFHNLRGLSPQPFKPQKTYLLILNLGDGTGLLSWRGLVVHSRWAEQFKRWLDQRFIRRAQRNLTEKEGSGT